MLGEIKNGVLFLNDAGLMVKTQWIALCMRFSNIELHEYIVMPNHFHAILEIVGATLGVAPVVVTPSVAPVEQNNNMIDKNDHTDTRNNVGNLEGQPQGIAPTIGDMVGAFESIVTVEYIHGVKNLGWKPFNGKLWQRNYYERIIRDEQSYLNITEYIKNNPAKWIDDKFYMK